MKRKEINLEEIFNANQTFEWVPKIFMETSSSLIDLNKYESFTPQEIQNLYAIYKSLTLNNSQQQSAQVQVKRLKKTSTKKLESISYKSPKSSTLRSVTEPKLDSLKSKEKEKERGEKGEFRKILKNHTGNSRKKCKLGHMFDYEIEHPKVLSKNFTEKSGKVECYLYSIEIIRKKSYCVHSLEKETHKSAEKSFGIILPFHIPFSLPVTLLNPKSFSMKIFSIEFYQINFIAKLSLPVDTFKKLIVFHIHIFSDMSSPHLPDELSNPYKRLLSQSDERKYLLAPIKIGTGQTSWILNESKIKKCYDYHNKNIIGKSIRNIILAQRNKLNPSCGITEEYTERVIYKILRSKIFFSTYKIQNFFEITELFYANESLDDMLIKIANSYNEKNKELDIKKKHIEEIIANLKLKYFPNMNEKTYSSTNVKDVMFTVDTSCQSILAFRKLGEKMNIVIDTNACAFAYGNVLKSITLFDYTYNKALSLKHFTHSMRKKKKFEGESSIHSIFPIDSLCSYFLNVKLYKLMTRIPTILSSFERILIPYQMICDFGIVFDLNNRMHVENFKYFLWAGTSPSLMQDYHFESLETLGDSIIKFILTLLLYLHFPEMSEGEMQSRRSNLLKNDTLHEIGLKQEIYKYVVNTPFNIHNWDYPIKTDIKQKYEQNLTKKMMADAIEAYVGANFLKESNLRDAFTFMTMCGIIPAQIYQHVGNEVLEKISNGIVVDGYSLISNYKPLGSDFMTKASQMLKIDMSVSQIFQLFHPEVSNNADFTTLSAVSDSDDSLFDDDSTNIAVRNLAVLEKIIRYTFKNKELLQLAFTHSSSSKENINTCYERLELLGDSIVEVYIIISLFNIFKDELYKDDQNSNFTFDEKNCTIDEEIEGEEESDNGTTEEKINISNDDGNDITIEKSKHNAIISNSSAFSCETLTHVKSFLASNQFMVKISAILRLHEYIILTNPKYKEILLAFSTSENITAILSQNLNEYENPNNLKPKIVADVFEALLGAILIDSSLEECFKFLDICYGPFVIYCAKYLNSIKYSPVSELTSLCIAKFGTFPVFIRTKSGSSIVVEVRIKDKKLCEGEGSSEDQAKEAASIEGIRLLQLGVEVG